MCLCEIICESPASSESLLWSGHPWPRRSPQSFLAEMCWTSARVRGYLCCRAAPVLAFTPCVGGSCSISLATAPCLLPAKILSMDFTPLCISFIDIYFSLLWKLLCLQPVVKGGSSSVFRLPPRAEDSQVSSTRSVCGALDTASSKLTNKLDT